MITSVSLLDYRVTVFLAAHTEPIIACARGFIGNWFIEVRGDSPHRYVYTFINIITGDWFTTSDYSEAAGFI